MVRSGARLATLVAVVVIALTVAAQAADARVVWLCKPGQHPDPCSPGLSTTVYSPTLHKLRVTHPKAIRDPNVDCFYVYPTVSDQTTVLSNLMIDPEERSIALYQAARYSQDCRVFAPMYRQVTIAGAAKLGGESPAHGWCRRSCSAATCWSRTARTCVGPSSTSRPAVPTSSSGV